MDYGFLEPGRRISHNGGDYKILSVPSASPYQIEVENLTQTGDFVVSFTFLDFLKPDLQFALSVL
jgi:hypothetical protein